MPFDITLSWCIDAIQLATTWPTVLEGVSNLKDWASELTNQSERYNLFSLASPELESVRSSPAWPVPQSIKWLTALAAQTLNTFTLNSNLGIAGGDVS